jgi:hypothetical protein
MSARWSVEEVVSWIAYRDPQPIGNWGKFTIWTYDWPVRPPDVILDPLETLALGFPPDGAVPADITAAAVRFVHETGRSAADLAQALRSDISRNQEFESKINTAMAEMQRAVTERRLQVYAVPEGQTYATRSPVDPDIFIRFPLSVHLHGRIAPRRPGLRYRGPCFESAAFEPDEVQRVWPPPPPPPPVAVPGTYEWLLAEATRHLAKYNSPAKQTDIVQRCIAAIGGKVRETTALHQTLPEELRYVRGKGRR